MDVELIELLFSAVWTMSYTTLQNIELVWTKIPGQLISCKGPIYWPPWPCN